MSKYILLWKVKLGFISGLFYSAFQFFSNVIFFSNFNDLYKKEGSSFDFEKHKNGEAE